MIEGRCENEYRVAHGLAERIVNDRVKDRTCALVISADFRYDTSCQLQEIQGNCLPCRDSSPQDVRPVAASEGFHSIAFP